MKNIAWTILLVSALTDSLIVAISGIASAMASTGHVELPNTAVIVINLLFGAVAAARTIQQALKPVIAPQVNQALKGE